MINIFIFIIVFLWVLFVVRHVLVHKIRMNHLRVLNAMTIVGMSVTKHLDRFEQTNRLWQVLDLRKWTRNQFFEEDL